MDDIVLMQKYEGLQNLGCEIPNVLLSEVLFLISLVFQNLNEES
jgi:hypothetical protein